MSPDQEYVLKTIKLRDVHFVRFWFPDVMGAMKSFAVNPNELENAFEEGMGFDASCISGFSPAEQSDMLAFPDASTFQILPWRPDSNSVARMFCTIKTPDGYPFEGDSRRILQRAVEKASDAGFIANIGPEVEYFYLDNPHDRNLLDKGGYFDLTSLDSGSDLRRDTVLTLERMGIPVEYSHHESGPSQHEVDLRYSDACSMADAVMTYRVVVKEIAAKHGVYATFMPKPFTEHPGSGMHVHMSLFDREDRNVFFDPRDPDGYNLSSTAKQFIAGLLKYAPEYCLVTNQYVNSYKRLMGGGEAPRFISWGRSNRRALVRVPGYRPRKEMACRVELRMPDPACNPYLAFAVALTAGLRGIEECLPLPEPAEGGADACFSRDRAGDLGSLPTTLGAAIDAFEGSSLAREVLGDHVHEYLVDAKRREWMEYLSTVTAWERDRWMDVL